MKYLYILSILLCSLLICNTSSFAQNISDKPFIAPSNAGGEETILNLEMIVRDVNSGGERLFVLSRLSTNENPRQTNFRLHNTKQKLLLMGIDSQKSIFAEGERLIGEGRIEFYLGSNLRLVILAKRNQMPNLSCCEDYNPPIKRKSRKRKN